MLHYVPVLFSENCHQTCGLRCVPQRAEEFKVVSKEIVSLASKAFFQMVHLDCEELKQGLVSKANSYAEVLLEKMITSLREENKQSVTRQIFPLVFKIFSLSGLFFDLFKDLR